MYSPFNFQCFIVFNVTFRVAFSYLTDSIDILSFNSMKGGGIMRLFRSYLPYSIAFSHCFLKMSHFFASPPLIPPVSIRFYCCFKMSHFHVTLRVILQ